MTFTFRPATRDRIGLLFGLAGATGSGKTYSALLLAQGVIGDAGKMAILDTEAGRAKHYAKKFDFLHSDFAPPYEPMRYIEGFRAAETAGAAVCIADSMSHEWAGEGGCADMQAREAERMATGKDGKVVAWKIEAMTAPAWKRPKIEHKRMVARIVQSRMHLFLCFRAEEKVRFVKEKDSNGRDKTVIVPVGFQPICEKSFMFEMTAFLTFHPESPGVVRYDLPHKLNDELKEIFRDGDLITRESGERLRKWAESGADTRMSPADHKIADGVRALIEKIEDCGNRDALDHIISDPAVSKQHAWLIENRPEMGERLANAIAEAVSRTEPLDDIENV